MQHRCVVAQPLPIPLPFPQFFGSCVSRFGDVLPNTMRAPGEDIESVPLLSRLGAGDPSQEYAARQLAAFRGLCVYHQLLLQIECPWSVNSQRQWMQSWQGRRPAGVRQQAGGRARRRRKAFWSSCMRWQNRVQTVVAMMMGEMEVHVIDRLVFGMLLLCKQRC